MNNQKKGIDWCDYTWNPVSGCKHNCWYCYARETYKRFNMDFAPTFKEHKLKEPFDIKKPSKIFVCSVADLFGEWVPSEWIEKIISVTKKLPQHEFMFLTKNSKRYWKFNFPKNCWLGVTITGEENESEIATKFAGVHVKTKNKKFISFEPLLGKINIHKDVLAIIDLIIVGAMTGKNAVIPKKEWIDSIKHKNLEYKKNIKKYLTN